jgi:signal recognition particle receptor subunit beta
MVLFNYSTKELTAKVVYYGPGLCGKTTNLQWIHEKLPIRNKGKMLSLATETDRTLFFDFLPIELGTIRGMKTRIQLYTVPGQVFYNATRRMVLKGADCVVFVCDSQEPMIEANVESLENLKQNMEANELDPEEMPLVLQYNKRDLPNALPIEILNERLNPRGVPFFEAVAIKGQGVEETLKGVTQLVFRSLATKYGGADAGSVPPPAPVKPAPAPAPAPPPRAAAPAPPPPASPLPPIQMEAPVESGDDLLDSLELQPAPDELLSAGGDEEIETLDIEEDLGMTTSPPAVPAAPPVPPAPAAASQVGKTTLISSQKETDELRRKIARPVLEDLNLEDIVEEEDDEIEELSFDDPPVAQPAPPPPPAPAQKPVAARPPEPPPAPRPVAPPPPPVAVAAGIQTVDAAPVSVKLASAVAGQADVSIPVEVTVGEGPAQVAIHIRLTLSLKLQR